MRGPSECSDDKRLPEIRKAVEPGLQGNRVKNGVTIGANAESIASH